MNNNNDFLCPNCGSTESKDEQYVSVDPPAPKDKNPWSSVLQIITCKQCHREIPAHLGERWDNRSIEDAKKEWIEQFKYYKKK